MHYFIYSLLQDKFENVNSISSKESKIQFLEVVEKENLFAFTFDWLRIINFKKQNC